VLAAARQSELGSFGGKPLTVAHEDGVHRPIQGIGGATGAEGVGVGEGSVRIVGDGLNHGLKGK